MKNIKLGLLVFSLLTEFLRALGRGDGSLAPPPRGHAEAGVGTLSFYSPPVPQELGGWSSISPGAQKEGNSILRAEEGRRIFD